MSHSPGLDAFSAPPEKGDTRGRPSPASIPAPPGHRRSAVSAPALQRSQSAGCPDGAQMSARRQQRQPRRGHRQAPLRAAPLRAAPRRQSPCADGQPETPPRAVAWELLLGQICCHQRQTKPLAKPCGWRQRAAGAAPRRPPGTMAASRQPAVRGRTKALAASKLQLLPQHKTRGRKFGPFHLSAPRRCGGGEQARTSHLPLPAAATGARSLQGPGALPQVLSVLQQRGPACGGSAVGTQAVEGCGEYRPPQSCLPCAALPGGG